MSLHKDCLEIILDPNNTNLTRSKNWQSINVLAFGKAAYAMAKAARDIIPKHLFQTPGLVVTNYENVTEIDNFQVFGAGHPLPDQAGLESANFFARRAQLATAEELVLVLISGGDSALLPSLRS